MQAAVAHVGRYVETELAFAKWKKKDFRPVTDAKKVQKEDNKQGVMSVFQWEYEW